jgi:hypothetical protein
MMSVPEEKAFCYVRVFHICNVKKGSECFVTIMKSSLLSTPILL